MSKRFSELLNDGLFTVAKRQRKRLDGIKREVAESLGYSSSTIDSWLYRGKTPKDPQHMAFLVRYCADYGRVGREWANNILVHAHYPHREALLNEIFPRQAQKTETPHVYQNLPPRYGEFLGRETDMQRVLEGLESRWPLVSIEGMGGVGKTTLAIESTRHCLVGDEHTSSIQFDAAIWISAKDRLEQEHWLKDVLDTIAEVLDFPYITRLTMDEKMPEVDRLLRIHRALIIIDNFETIEDPELEQWLQKAPEPSKVLITSRHAQLRSTWAIHLYGLEEPEALELIRQQSRRLRLKDIENADSELLLPLVRITDGNPKAIEMALGHVKFGLGLDDVIDQLYEASQNVNDAFEYLFNHSWNILSEDARCILLVITFFADSMNKDVLGATAGLDGYRRDVALRQLVETSLLDVEGGVMGSQRRYTAHPLTRSFAKSKAKESLEWLCDARNRWVTWYLDFSRTYGDKDWQDWHTHYDRLEEEWSNLLAVFQWCKSQEKYEDLKAFWLRKRVGGFANLYGYWEDRVNWLDWLISEAEKRSDWTTGIDAMKEKAWTLTLMGQEANAHALFEKASEFLHYSDLPTQVELAHDRGVLCIRQGKYEQARYWLDEAEAILAKADLDEKEFGRSWIAIIYYRAEILFRTGDYENAKELYEEMFTHGKRIGWERAVIYAQNWLADIAIQQDNLEQAERLLHRGLPQAERNKDRRRTAFYKRSLAYLEKKRGHASNACQWAAAALDGFDRLGMNPEVEELQEFMESLGC